MARFPFRSRLSPPRFAARWSGFHRSIGLLLGWCLLQLAYHQQFAAALLLPLYYLSDATVTLLRRLARREPFWAAHRSHFYQRATDNGFTVMRVVGEVFVLNLGLAALAILSIHAGST